MNATTQSAHKALVGLGALVLAALALIGTILATRNVHAPAVTATQGTPSAARPSTAPSAPVALKDTAVAPVPPADRTAPAVPDEHAAKATSLATSFSATIRSPLRAARQRELLDAIMADRAVEDLFLDALHSPAGSALFGEGQAEARVVALMVLKRRAKDGDAAPLLAHMHQLRDELVRGTGLNKAADKDFIDMVADYAEVRGAEDIAANPPEFLATVGYRPDLARHFRRGIFLALNGALSEERYHALFGSLYRDSQPMQTPEEHHVQ